MNHHFVSRISCLEPGAMDVFDEPALQRSLGTLCLAIQRDISEPLFFGRSRLRRMRVIIVGPASGSADPNSDPLAELLPPLPAPALLPRNLPLQPRLVNGEILQGENEELFERIGNRIRRLRRLVSGPNGEILDVANLGLLTPPRRACVPAPSAANNEQIQAKPEKTDSSKARPAAAAFRILFPEPGQWRVVAFGAFKQMLVSQLAHPERLRDGHRLPCYAQVYEVTAAQRIEKLFAGLCGNIAFSGQLQLLTQATIMELHLGPLLPPRAQFPRPAQREPRMLFPGQRVLRLQLANDPTTNDLEPEKSALSLTAEGSTESTRTPLKTAIPERFLKPWELSVSREEALYDLSATSTFTGGVRCLIWRLTHWLTFHREFRKWQVLLNGKNIEEQLWAVRPPKGGLAHRFILAWAKNAIELGGYDPRNMLTEWQIFWKRKGV
jgi:hypothetical protein